MGTHSFDMTGKSTNMLLRKSEPTSSLSIFGEVGFDLKDRRCSMTFSRFCSPSPFFWYSGPSTK